MIKCDYKGPTLLLILNNVNSLEVLSFGALLLTPPRHFVLILGSIKKPFLGALPVSSPHRNL